MEKLDGLSLPMTMGDWVLIMESVNARIKMMKTVDPESLAEDDLAEMYTDQQNLEGILRYMTIEFEKAYGTLPDLDR